MLIPLMLVSGFFWTLTYILIIRRSWLDRSYGMPLVALCANISWEFIFAFILPHPPPQLYVNMTWFAFDTAIFILALRYGTREFPKWPARMFYAAFALALVTAFCAVLFITYEFDERDGAYAAFGQNLMMSVLFIDMLMRRNSVRGQSVYIALFKLIGTLIASLAFQFFTSRHSLLFSFLYVSILVFDAIYVIMVYRQARAEGMNPWRRF